MGMGTNPKELDLIGDCDQQIKMATSPLMKRTKNRLVVTISKLVGIVYCRLYFVRIKYISAKQAVFQPDQNCVEHILL